jgi:hypothetical protein
MLQDNIKKLFEKSNEIDNPNYNQERERIFNNYQMLAKLLRKNIFSI